MAKKKNIPNRYTELREKALKLLGQKKEAASGMQYRDIKEVLQELEIHQSELEIQNEELRKIQQELVQLRDKYFNLFEFAPVGYFTVNAQGMVQEANLTAVKLLEMDRRDIVNRPFSRLIDPEHHHIFYFHIKHSSSSETTNTSEMKLLRKGSKPFYAWVEYAIDTDDQDVFRGMRLAVLDIQERIELENELEKTARTYRHIVENAPSGIYEIDFEEMRFRSANEAAIRMTGHSREEMLNMNPLDLLTPESRERFLERLAVMQAGSEPSTEVEFEVYRKNGERTWVLLAIRFHRRDGKITRATVVVTDIQERKRMERKLKRSERRFRTLAENAPDIISRYDTDLHHLYVSPAIKPVTGIDHREFIGKTNEELGMPPELCKTWRDFQEGVLKSGKPAFLEFSFQNPQGDTLYFDMRAVPEYSEQGEIDSLMCITRDITDRHTALTEKDRLSENLEVERARLQAIISFAPQGIVVTDEKARIIMTNAVADKLYTRDVPFGESFESHEALQLYDLHGRRINPRDLPLSRAALDGETHLNEELIILHPDGEKRVLLVNASPIGGKQSTIAGAVGIFQDITDRREELNMESEDRARTYAKHIMETVSMPILLLDSDLKVETANHSFYRSFLLSPRDTIGIHICELGSGEWNIDEFIAMLEEITERKRSEMKYLLDCTYEKIGRRILRINAQRLRSADEYQEKVVLTLDDITEEKLAEEEQRAYQDRLRSLSIKLVNSEEKERQRIAGGLHDHVVQSLTATRMKLALLKENAASDGGAKELEDVDRVISESIEDIRELSFELSSPFLQTGGLVDTIEWFAEKFARKYNIPVIVKDERTEKPVDNDVAIVIFQSVRELLNNVIKHAQAGQVTIDIRKTDNNLVVELRDNGVGFDTSDLFKAMNRSKGFGLFNIRERLDYLGGSLELESDIGKGTRVVLTAPLKGKQS